jgi:hypothetical protein
MEYFKIFITMLCYTFSDIMFDHTSDYERKYAFFFQYDSAQDRIANNSRCCLESVPCDRIISRGSWPPGSREPFVRIVSVKELYLLKDKVYSNVHRPKTIGKKNTFGL